MFVCVHKIAGLCVCDDEAHESVNMSAIVSENVQNRRMCAQMRRVCRGSQGSALTQAKGC